MKESYNTACFHIMASSVLIAELILSTREVNHRLFAVMMRVLFGVTTEYCNVVAETPAKNIATVVALKCRVAECC